MLERNARIRAALLSAALVAGCAGHPWPDEPGVPVALSRATNGQADDAFLARLTADRRAANLPAPLLTPSHQTDIRAFAEDLQAGKLTASEAQRAIERWGRAAYQRPVAVWLIDCAAGENMKLPGALVSRPSAVVSFASAHFRPRSLAADQCAVLVVAVEGAEQVTEQKM